MGILERIKEIEQEMDKTQRNKATEGHLGMLKARLAKLRSELLTPSSGGGGGQVIFPFSCGMVVCTAIGYRRRCMRGVDCFLSPLTRKPLQCCCISGQLGQRNTRRACTQRDSDVYQQTGTRESVQQKMGRATTTYKQQPHDLGNMAYRPHAQIEHGSGWYGGSAH